MEWKTFYVLRGAGGAIELRHLSCPLSCAPLSPSRLANMRRESKLGGPCFDNFDRSICRPRERGSLDPRMDGGVERVNCESLI